VEGAGGLLVRLGEDFTLADVASALNAPLVIVTSTGLGSLNAAELSVEAANRRGLTVLGVLGGSIPQNPDLATMLNLEEFERVTGVPFWGALPEGLSRVEGFVEKQSFPALDAFKKPPAR
jgi:dethiobiotin synthetase